MNTLPELALTAGTLPSTVMEYVAQKLREGILTGTLSEGRQLVQSDIAEALRVSRTPIREALRLLEAEGLVEFSPHRGAVVARLSVDEVRQIFEIRFALETLALRKSVPATEPATYDRAAAILLELDTETEIGRWVDLNRSFHLALYMGAGPRLIDLIESQYDAVDRYLRVELAAMHNAAESQDEHRAILAACRKGDIEHAVALLEPHIHQAGFELAAALEARRPASG